MKTSFGLGFSTSKALQTTLFFYVRLRFALRGVQEQHDLLHDQFVRVPTDMSIYNQQVYYEYIEYISKNDQHRFKDINTTAKRTRAYAIVGSVSCVVKLLDMYLCKLPSMSPHVYTRPLDRIPEGPEP